MVDLRRGQVVRKETAKLTKDLALHEKEEVKLQEKKKHAVTKQKKLKKTISDVRRCPFASDLLSSLTIFVFLITITLTFGHDRVRVPESQDTHALSEAQATIETLGAQLKKRRKELEALEAELEAEEGELEVIQDSLKGSFLYSLSHPYPRTHFLIPFTI